MDHLPAAVPWDFYSRRHSDTKACMSETNSRTNPGARLTAHVLSTTLIPGSHTPPLSARTPP